MTTTACNACQPRSPQEDLDRRLSTYEDTLRFGHLTGADREQAVTAYRDQDIAPAGTPEGHAYIADAAAEALCDLYTGAGPDHMHAAIDGINRSAAEKGVPALSLTGPAPCICQ